MRVSRVFRTIVLLALSALSSSGCVTVTPPPPPPPPPARVTIVTFYEALAPHGDWIFIAGFGHVWRPRPQIVGVGFIPYATGGRWEYSELGWVFDSNWEWGTIVFHYGRWFHLDREGWLWVPDTVWGPAWVEWRYGGGYVCWAPLPPPRVTVVVVVYRPFWYVVPTRYFPQGRHDRHRATEHEATRVVAQAPPVPVRSQPSGESWHVGPPAYGVAGEANLEIRPRTVQRPPPVPVGALEVPKSARISQFPPRGERPPPGEPSAGSPRGESPSRAEPERKPTPPPILEPEPKVTPAPRVTPASKPAQPGTKRVQPPPPVGGKGATPPAGANPRGDPPSKKE